MIVDTQADLYLDTQTYLHVPILASTNLPAQGNLTWELDDLLKMAITYRDKPIALNHSSAVQTQLGVIYQAEIITFENPSAALRREMMKGSTNLAAARRIMRNDGLHLLFLSGATQFPTLAAENILSRSWQDVSIHVSGNINEGFKYVCPKHRQEFKECGCIPPTPFILWFAKPYMDSDELKKLAEYYIVQGINSAVELSIVQDGDNTPAQIISQRLAEILLNS